VSESPFKDEQGWPRQPRNQEERDHWDALDRAAAVKTFHQAQKRAIALIVKRSKGDPNDKQIRSAIDRLHKLRNEPEIRGHAETADQADRVIGAVQEAYIAARDAGDAANREARHAQIAALDEERREKNARSLGTFERELDLQRRGLTPKRYDR